LGKFTLGYSNRAGDKPGNLKRNHMVFFLRMPTGAIWIGGCGDDEDVNIKISKIRSDYEPAFLYKIATIADEKLSRIRKTLASSRINGTQYQPAPELLDFINERHDESPYFRKLEYIDGFENILESKKDLTKHGMIEISLPNHVKEFLTHDGMNQGVSPFDIIRELTDFYMKIRIAKRSGVDVQSQVETFVRYLTR
jgi:hypothetical protein